MGSGDLLQVKEGGIMQKRKSLTDEQKLFISCNILIEKVRNDFSAGLITKQAMKSKIDSLNQKLWDSQVKFAMKTANEMMQKYRRYKDAYQDVEQACACKFFEVLPKYDPYYTTPTTYFVRYYREVISDYLHRFSQNLTAYDAGNVSKVRKAIDFYEKRNLRWNPSVLSTRTGLSAKVVKNTIKFMQTTTYMPIDDKFDCASKIPGPEATCISNDIENRLYSIIRDDTNLTPLAKRVFFEKVNLIGGGGTYVR